MIPFLQQVAAHWYAAGQIDGTCFVFPNRRSLVFFRKYLCGCVAQDNASRPPQERRPLLLPEMLTINDFFYRIADADVSDRVTLLLELYDSYKTLNPKAEPLDDFIFWGDVILNDFSDVDKYLVDPHQLFTNVGEFRAMQDNYSYLTEAQRAAIVQFVSHFRDGGKLKVDLGADQPGVKERFLQIWNILYPLYEDFRTRLRAQHLAYDGMVYRELAEKMRTAPAVDILSEGFPAVSRFAFIGLNALSTSELFVLGKMKDAGLAEFCWDYSSPMIRDPHNRSSFFMESNIARLGGAFRADTQESLPETSFHVVSVPSAVGQAKQLPDLLRGVDPSRTAIVLPDESLLQPVLSAIPPEIQDINVTMGAPLTGSILASLMTDIGALQLHLRQQEGSWMFYHRQVWSIFSSRLLRAALDEGDLACVEAVKKEAQYYIPQERFAGHPLLELIFRPVATEPKAADAAQVRALEDYQTALVSTLAARVKEVMPQEVEFARRYVQCVSRLRAKELAVQPQTYFRLLSQLLAGESVPYNGEPVKGLQVMGPLETRALDFDTVIILSCNEGVFPRRNVSSSFIPPELRKGFEMPTYEYQDAVWAYYFYRLVQRASQVWLLYDSRTEKMKPGEESRYIKQLQYHFRVPLQRSVAQASLGTPKTEDSFPKPADMAQRLKARPLSASALQAWLACPARFYYAYLEGLEADEEVSESLDAGMLGNVYHKTMQALYTDERAMDPAFSMEGIASLPAMQWVTDAYLERWLKRPGDLRARIHTLICAEMHAREVSGRNLVLGDVILQYVQKTLERDRQRMREKGTDRFRVLGLESKRFWQHDGYTFKGFIDRMDSFSEDELRIVDYKTGRVKEEDVLITDENAAAIVERVFGEKEEDRPKIALQLFLYDMYVSEGIPERLDRLVNVIYPASRLFTAPPPEARVSREFCRLMQDRLRDLLAEMADPALPVRRTQDRTTCSYCDFRNICGR